MTSKDITQAILATPATVGVHLPSVDRKPATSFRLDPATALPA